MLQCVSERFMLFKRYQRGFREHFMLSNEVYRHFRCSEAFEGGTMRFTMFRSILERFRALQEVSKRVTHRPSDEL